MRFKSKPEAYSFVILYLERLKHRYPHVNIIHSCLENVRIAFENHEQNPTVVANHIATILPHLDSIDTTNLQQVINAITTSDYKQTPQEKFASPLARRAESEMSSTILLKPTTQMMMAVKAMSTEIIKVIESLEKSSSYLIHSFKNKLPTHNLPNGAFGAPVHSPSIEAVKKLLTDNDANTLVAIMHIHFKFGRYIFREVPITTHSAREPIGALKDIIKEIWPAAPEKFFTEGLRGYSHTAKRNRSYVADEKFYASDLYKSEDGERGRLSGIMNIYTNQLGLMLREQKEDAAELPSLSNAWVPDCSNQAPNLDSQYVIDLIDNDAVYVSGPSGMTSVLLGQMEILANFNTLAMKQLYLAAVVAYIVSGGHHSIHEVIGPAQYVLQLVPGYNVAPPISHKIAAPPNYHAFFHQQAIIDPEFNNRRQLFWSRYMNYFEQHYLPRHSHITIPLPTARPALRNETTNSTNVVAMTGLGTRLFSGNAHLRSLNKQEDTTLTRGNAVYRAR